MADEPESKKPDPAPQPTSALTGLSGDAVCVVIFILLFITGAAVQIFNSSLGSGDAWAGTLAVTALAAMGVGVVYILAKFRA